jgi:hypothetical protein
VMTDGCPDRASLCTSLLPSPIKQMTPLTHVPHTLRQVGDGFRQGESFSHSKSQITERTSQSVVLVIDMVLYKALWHSNRSLTGEVAEGLTTFKHLPSVTCVSSVCANCSDFKNDVHSFWSGLDSTRVQFPALPDFSEQQWVWNGVHSASWTIWRAIWKK